LIDARVHPFNTEQSRIASRVTLNHPAMHLSRLHTSSRDAAREMTRANDEERRPLAHRGADDATGTLTSTRARDETADARIAASGRAVDYGVAREARGDGDGDASGCDVRVDVDRVERGERRTSMTCAPSRRTRAAATTATALAALAGTLVAFQPRIGSFESSLSSMRRGLGSDSDADAGWVRSDAAERSSFPGGWRLPKGYKRSDAWSMSEHSSATSYSVTTGWTRLGSMFSWPSQGLPDARSWDPTEVKLTTGGTLPSEFDARTKWPECASLIDDPIDQGECGSCWAVAPAKVMSDRLCIATNGRVSTHLSGLQLLSCAAKRGDGFRPSSDIGGCGGGFPMNAYENAKLNGLVSGAQFGDRQTCMPYSFKPCHHPCKHGEEAKCPGTCSNDGTNASSIFRVDSLVSCRDGDFDCMALEIFNNGPVSSFVGTVFDEFYKYQSGVYSLSKDVSIRGSSHGGHVMEVIGWGITEKGVRYWKVYNSWLNWGQNGYGKIAMGELHIGETVEAATMRPV
jgi:cathepsin B